MSESKIWYVYPPQGPRVMVSGAYIEAILDGRLEIRDENDSVHARFEREGWARVTTEKLESVFVEHTLFTNKIFPAQAMA